MTPSLRRLPLIAAGVAAAVALVATNEPGQISLATTAPLAGAVRACNLGSSPYVDVLDSDHTLTIHGDGDEATGLHMDSIGCLLGEVDVTGAVVERMDRTRALDGMQDATWGDYSASWTYHPDDGLNVVITRGEP
jgi:hypothetical protein